MSSISTKNTSSIFHTVFFWIRLKANFLLLIIAIAAVVYWSSILILSVWSFNTDDAYITMRYARHLYEGHGLLWNVGEPPVEGYSNFLFVLIAVASLKAGIEPITTYKIIGLISLSLTIIFLTLLTRKLTNATLAAVPSILLISYPGTIWWTVSGLETSFFQLLAVSSFYFFFLGLDHYNNSADNEAIKTHNYSSGWFGLSGFLVFIAGLTRPEGPVIGILLGIGLIMDLSVRLRKAYVDEGKDKALRIFKQSIMPFILLISFFVIPYGVYFAWRYFYYGNLFPNTVYCKMNWSGDPLTLIRNYVDILIIPFLIAISGLIIKFDKRVFMLVVFNFIYIFMLYGADPIVGHYNRHFLAAYAFILPAATFGYMVIKRKLFPTGIQKAADIFILATVLTISALVIPQQRNILEARADGYAERMKARAELGHWLDSRLNINQTYVIGDAGIVPYITRAMVIDAFCLNCAEATKTPINLKAKPYAEYILSRRPEIIVIHSSSSEAIKPREPIFEALIAHPIFKAEYRNSKLFGFRTYQYYVFEHTFISEQD